MVTWLRIPFAWLGGTLDGSPIQVSSEELTDDHPSVAGDHDGHDDIPQESKPRCVSSSWTFLQRCEY